MKARYINKKGGSLTLFFAGWGMDATPFEDYTDGCDIVVLYDYSDMSFDASLLEGRECYDVVGWSMGVMAASLVVPTLGVNPRRSIAVGGTTTPVSERYGIAPAIFDATLDGLCDKSVASFRRRMCGGASAAAFFEARAPKRDVGSLKEELAAIGKMALENENMQMKWDCAVITMRDAIFLPQNQRAAHLRDGVTEIVERDVPHYDYLLLKNLTEGRDG